MPEVVVTSANNGGPAGAASVGGLGAGGVSRPAVGLQPMVINMATRPARTASPQPDRGEVCADAMTRPKGPAAHARGAATKPSRVHRTGKPFQIAALRRCFR